MKKLESIKFKKYEEDKGFEEYQAQIYNAVATKYKAPLFSAEDIKKRLHEHTPTQDRKGMTFAFNSSMKPLAYIQYREYPNEGDKVKIGYPWAIDGTPVEVQDKLFYDLLGYLKSKYPEKPAFYLGFLDYLFTDIHESIKNRYKFQIDTWFAYYSVEQSAFAKIDIPDEYTCKSASITDLELIIEICMADVSVAGMGVDGIKEFFSNNIFAEEEADKKLCVILLKNNVPIGTIAVLNTIFNEKKFNQGQIIALKKGEENSFFILIASLIKELVKKNWNQPVLLPIDNTVAYQEEEAKKYGGTVVGKEIQYKLPVK